MLWSLKCHPGKMHCFCLLKSSLANKRKASQKCPLSSFLENDLLCPLKERRALVDSSWRKKVQLFYANQTYSVHTKAPDMWAVSTCLQQGQRTPWNMLQSWALLRWAWLSILNTQQPPKPPWAAALWLPWLMNLKSEFHWQWNGEFTKELHYKKGQRRKQSPCLAEVGPRDALSVRTCSSGRVGWPVQPSQWDAPENIWGLSSPHTVSCSRSLAIKFPAGIWSSLFHAKGKPSAEKHREDLLSSSPWPWRPHCPPLSSPSLVISSVQRSSSNCLWLFA